MLTILDFDNFKTIAMLNPPEYLGKDGLIVLTNDSIKFNTFLQTLKNYSTAQVFRNGLTIYTESLILLNGLTQQEFDNKFDLLSINKTIIHKNSEEAKKYLEFLENASEIKKEEVVSFVNKETLLKNFGSNSFSFNLFEFFEKLKKQYQFLNFTSQEIKSFIFKKWLRNLSLTDLLEFISVSFFFNQKENELNDPDQDFFYFIMSLISLELTNPKVMDTKNIKENLGHIGFYAILEYCQRLMKTYNIKSNFKFIDINSNTKFKISLLKNSKLSKDELKASFQKDFKLYINSLIEKKFYGLNSIKETLFFIFENNLEIEV